MTMNGLFVAKCRKTFHYHYQQKDIATTKVLHKGTLR